MKLVSNIMPFEKAEDLTKIIDILSAAGFDGIDFNANLPEYYGDAHDEAFYREARAYAEDRGIVFSQAHAPFASSFAEEEKNRRRFEEILRGMQHAAWLGAEILVVHPCAHLKHKQKNHRQLLLDYNVDFFQRLLPYAVDAGMKIAIENIPGTITETAEGLLELLHALNHPAFTLCLDAGHAHVMRVNAAEMVLKLGSAIGCTHIHDNDGVSDLHQMPFFGTIGWEEVMAAFAQIGYSGNLSYESGVFAKNAPAELYPAAARYMADTGRHLIECFQKHQREMS